MGLTEELKRQKQIYARCPNCDKDFRLRDAKLFDATKILPQYAVSYLRDRQLELVDERAELRKRREKANLRPRVAAESVGIGKVVERIAPSLPGFPVRSSDCRSLFDPIDYLVFHGLSMKGRVDAIHFVDVKSGGARLSPIQREVKNVVEAGKVRLLIVPRPDDVGVT